MRLAGEVEDLLPIVAVAQGDDPSDAHPQDPVGVVISRWP